MVRKIRLQSVEERPIEIIAEEIESGYLCFKTEWSEEKENEIMNVEWKDLNSPEDIYECHSQSSTDDGRTAFFFYLFG